ncbi:MAG TPA: protein phosphatase 2C domain-containing protein [Kofleriaceae bacterium]|nr:protein phosphatase 2C domain-containing protein [Kofleriaceae bacterium]
MTAVSTDDAPRVTLEAWLVTDVGVVRDHNEDSACMEPVAGFFIVADGMGGHAAGEVASAMAVETVKKTLEGARGEIDTFKKGPDDAGRRQIVQLLQNAVLQAHQAVYQRGQNEQDKAGMGTTLDVVLVAGGEAFVAHVGDSRTYLVRDGKSSQITTDHTVAEVLVIEGKLTLEEAAVSPLRTILVNAIGVSADVGVEMAHVTLRRGDKLLLCSDGLHDYFPIEEEIAQRLTTDKPGDALKEMVELAKTRGGHDNITGVAVHVTELVDAAGTLGAGDDNTQPVDAISGNPFMADEPTQTQMEGDGPTPPAMPPHDFRATQPMRAVVGASQAGGDADDIGNEPTIPPTLRDKLVENKAEPAEKADGDRKEDAAPAGELATADTGQISAAPKKD